MITTTLFRPDTCRKKCGDGRGKTITTTYPLESGTGEGGFLVCRACMRIITSEGEKIAMNGAHAHGFTNPHGLFFDVGCFRDAPGCIYSKQSSYEFSWFSGYAWRIAACRTCRTHLGWLFTSGSSRFNGLILNKLMSWDFKETQPSRG
jgi:hypothetical protein